MTEKEKAIQAVEKNNTLADFFQQNKKAIVDILPKHMSVDRMIKILFTSIRKNPLLAQCSKESLLSALIECAQLGLEPDGLRGHAYLVPFFNSKKNHYEVQMIPGYKGLVALAKRSGEISDIYCVSVFENEFFKITQGLDRNLLHEPLPPKERGEKIKACYCVAIFVSGLKSFSVMWNEEIEATRKRSKAANSGPWVSDYEAMAQKTVIRRQMRLMPLSPEIQELISKDELFDAGFSEDEINIPEKLQGKPIVALPEKNTEQDDLLYCDILDMCASMNYTETQTKEIDNMINVGGIKKTHDFILAEVEKWNAKTENTEARTTEKKSGTLL